MLSSVPFFAVMGLVKQYFSGQMSLATNNLDRSLIGLKTSVISGVFGTYFTAPTETSVIRMTKKPRCSFISAAQKIYRGVGIRGFFRGSVAALYRNNIYSLGVNFFPAMFDGKNQYAVSGISGFFMSILSHPFDTVSTLSKTRLHSKGLPVKFWLQRTVRKEGISGLFKGVCPRASRTGLGSMFFVFVMNQFKN